MTRMNRRRYLLYRRIRRYSDKVNGVTIGRSRIFLGACFAAGILITDPAFAADPAAVEETPAPAEAPVATEWHWAVDPLYSWLPGMSGDVAGFGGPGVSIDVTTWDIVENLDAFLHAIDGLYMGAGEYRNSQFGFQWDVVYLQLGESGSFGNRISGAFDIGFKMSMTTLAGNYRIYQSPVAYADIIAGARITDVVAEVDLGIGPIGFDASAGDTWIDPIVGVKGRYDLTPNWYIKGTALYGGFGVSSDHLYDVAGFAGYEWQNGFEMYGGWRVAYTDYENGDFRWDVRMSGPMMGFTFKF
jgi:hypothetical protein